MKTLYLDIFSGISGDMFLGALIDLGVDFNHLEREIAKLGVDGYHLHASKQSKASIQGTKFDVHLTHGHEHAHDHEHPHEHPHEHSEPTHEHEHHHHEHHQHGEHHHDHQHTEQPAHADHHHQSRNFAAIQKLIEASNLSDWVKQKSKKVFHRIAVAEGKIHGLPPEQVHFHEVGAIDSIVDIVGACIALEMLGKPRVLAAPVVEGTGWVKCAHGRFPVPTTATLEILGVRGIAITQCEEPNELVTPTGAALLAEFVEHFGPMQHVIANKIGYGLGTRDNRTRPNVLRAILSETGDSADAQELHDWERDTVCVLETNLDDCTPEVLGHFVDRALVAGALDVFYSPAQMKKNRPGVLLTILCDTQRADQFAAMLLRETSAFGIRRHLAERRKLVREFRRVQTPHGEVEVKIGKLDGQILHVSPEYESCKSVAGQKQLPLKTVYEAALSAADQWRRSDRR